MAKKKPKYTPSRSDVREWKAGLSKRSKRKYESLKSTKAKHEFMLRSMRAKAAYRAKQPTEPIIPLKIETLSDKYEGMIAEIYAAFDLPIAQYLERIILNYVTENDLSLEAYVESLNFDKISEYLAEESVFYSYKNKTKENATAIAEQLTHDELTSFEREEIGELVEGFI